MSSVFSPLLLMNVCLNVLSKKKVPFLQQTNEQEIRANNIF